MKIEFLTRPPSCHSRACAPERFSAQACKRESRHVFVETGRNKIKEWIPAGVYPVLDTGQE